MASTKFFVMLYWLQPLVAFRLELEPSDKNVHYQLSGSANFQPIGSARPEPGEVGIVQESGEWANGMNSSIMSSVASSRKKGRRKTPPKQIEKPPQFSPEMLAKGMDQLDPAAWIAKGAFGAVYQISGTPAPKGTQYCEVAVKVAKLKSGPESISLEEREVFFMKIASGATDGVNRIFSHTIDTETIEAEVGPPVKNRKIFIFQEYFEHDFGIFFSERDGGLKIENSPVVKAKGKRDDKRPLRALEDDVASEVSSALKSETKSKVSATSRRIGQGTPRAMEGDAAASKARSGLNSEAKSAVKANARAVDNDRPEHWKMVHLRVICCVLKALSVLHSGKLVHGDIKPRNILLAIKNRQTVRNAGIADFYPKLIDFGMTKMLHEEDTGLMGTLPFLPPEVHGFVIRNGRAEEKSLQRTESFDTWAVGIMADVIIKRHSVLLLPELKGPLANSTAMPGWRHLRKTWENVVWFMQPADAQAGFWLEDQKHFFNVSTTTGKEPGAFTTELQNLNDGRKKKVFSPPSLQILVDALEKKLVSGLLAFDPKKRLSANQALDIAIQLLEMTCLLNGVDSGTRKRIVNVEGYPAFGDKPSWVPDTNEEDTQRLARLETEYQLFK